MKTIYNHFTPLATFEHARSVYVKDCIYTARTTELQKLVGKWEGEGKVRIIPPSALARTQAAQAVARGTLETF